MTDGIPTRVCTKCGHRGPLTDFYGESKSRRCRRCTRLRLLERLRCQTEYIQKIKLDAGCMDCGLKTTVTEVYEFDHRPGTEKVDGIARLRFGTMAQLVAEIAKCDVVCANCHRIRTMRRGYGRNADWDQRQAIRQSLELTVEDPTLFDIA